MIAKSLSDVKYERCIRLNAIFKIDVFTNQNLFIASEIKCLIIHDSFLNVE